MRRAQIEAGASIVLTQPPLDWPAFEAWMEDVNRRRLHESARLLVGFPALTSASGAAFWAALCGAPGNAEVRSVQPLLPLPLPPIFLLEPQLQPQPPPRLPRVP